MWYMDAFYASVEQRDHPEEMGSGMRYCMLIFTKLRCDSF